MLVAEDVLTLSSCVHAAMAILYPFAWQHVFIPLLPTDMLEYASAPMPFVIGVSYVRVRYVDTSGQAQPLGVCSKTRLRLG